MNLTINQQSNLDALQEYLTSLADTVADLQKSVSSLEQSYAEIAGNSSTELTNISTLHGSIYENLRILRMKFWSDLTNAELNSPGKVRIHSGKHQQYDLVRDHRSGRGE